MIRLRRGVEFRGVGSGWDGYLMEAEGEGEAWLVVERSYYW